MSKNVAHAGRGKSLSSGEARENERRGWTEETYRRKNQRPLNNYDWSRRELNFEIVDGKICPLGSQEVSLYDRYLNVLKDVGFKQYKVGATNQQHTYIELILSGGTERMQELAFGSQRVDYARNPNKWHNRDIEREAAIGEWAIDAYNFVCGKFGKENVIGFEVHLDETAPHAHVNIVPTATKKQRGCVGGYIKVDADGNPAPYTKGKHVGELVKISDKKYEALSEEKKKQWRKNERGTVRTISYATYFGSTLEERSQALSKFHDDYYAQVGKKWGFERGDVWAELPEEERRKRGHRTKEQAYKEAMAKKAADAAQQEVDRLNADVQETKAKMENAKRIVAAAQHELERLTAITNLRQENVSDYVRPLHQTEFSVPRDVRDMLVSPLKNNPIIMNGRIVIEFSAADREKPDSLRPRTLQEIVDGEIEKVFENIGTFKLYSQKTAREAIRNIIWDQNTILIKVLGKKQAEGMIKANKEMYRAQKAKLAKYEEMQRDGITKESYTAAKKASSRLATTEKMLDTIWPGVRRAKDVLTNPSLNRRNFTVEEIKTISSALREKPEHRLNDMKNILGFASAETDLSPRTKVMAYILAADAAVKEITDKGYDLFREASSLLSSSASGVVESASAIAATAACLFFGFPDGAAAISEGCGGGGGNNDLPRKKNDEDDRKFAARCLQAAFCMHSPGRSRGRGR